MAGRAAFTLSAEDFVAMQRAVYLRQLRTRRFVVRLVLAAAAVWLAGAGVFHLLGEPQAEAFRLGLFILLGGAVGVTILIGGTYLLIPRRARRLFAQQRMLHYPMEVAWDAQGIGWRTPHGETRIPWSDYLAWQRTPTLFLLYASDLLLYTVPVRALDEAGAADIAAAAAAGGLPRR